MELRNLNALLLDEVSMIDDACFSGICDVLSIIDHTRRPNAEAADCFGPVHVLLFGGGRVYFAQGSIMILLLPSWRPSPHDQHKPSIDR